MFTDELARGIRHLLDASAPYGVYNLTGAGDPASWAAIAANDRADRARSGSGYPGYHRGVLRRRTSPVAPRPHNSALDLAKIEATGFRAARCGRLAGGLPERALGDSGATTLTDPIEPPHVGEIEGDQREAAGGGSRGDHAIDVVRLRITTPLPDAIETWSYTAAT